ncbi:uncharacterized protein LOC131617024 [Vicia villosa]|uniref:uncharacterized protein LOC131617024 n=1 Tax=Vicia villosa TaxID=3911 RepID=UPI00273B2AA4|nr:uncharacterized protein LOC131617024 [Vicia villosa]
MSQQPDSSSPKKLSPISEPESVSRAEPVNPNQVKKPRTPHARIPKETISVIRILDEKHKVLGTSIPLNTVIPEPHLNKEPDVPQDVETTEDSLGKKDDDVPIGVDDVPIDDDDVQHAYAVHNDGENVDVTQEVNDNAETGTDIEKGKKAVVQSTPKRKVVPKSTSVGPTKSWSKVVPKKIKARVIADSDSDVASDVPDIPPKKKPTSSKLVVRVPDVPIDNISFHSTSSVNRWKYVYQKRLALERELAQNDLEYKEIMELIHDAGLMKIVAHFATCYEVLVKEFIVNLSEECTDRKSKEFKKVYVRGMCVTFSSTMINNYLGRSDEAQPELEVSDNKVCQVITALPTLN